MSIPPIPPEVGHLVVASINPCQVTDKTCDHMSEDHFKRLELKSCSQDTMNGLEEYFVPRLGDMADVYLSSVQCVDTAGAFLKSAAFSESY